MLTVLRYVERNPLRARLTRRAEQWRWSSLRLRGPSAGPSILSPSPVPLPNNWSQHVHQPQAEAEVAALRTSINRGTPFGSAHWTKLAAARLGLESTLRPRGRPRKHPTK